MKNRRPNNRKLSVYLIEEKYKDFGSIIKGNADEYEVKRGGRAIGRLYVKSSYEHCPAWLSLFDGSVPADLPQKLRNLNTSAVFLLKQDERIFAITFGYGRSMLEPGTWEERFGLKVVLNSIDRDRIRVVDRKNLDTMLTQTRTHTSRKCAIEEFNLDVQQILLKAVTGEPRDETFAGSISGADALSINCQVSLDTIESKCSEFLKAFAAHDYQGAFAFVDNVSEVTNRQTVGELNEELIKRVKAGEEERLFLAIPDMVDWTAIDGFKFKENDKEVHSDILLSDFLESVRNIENLSCQFLRQRHVFQVHSETGFIEPRWPVFHCLNCEITAHGKSYILTEGRWFEINASFVAQVDARMRNVSKFTISLPARVNEKEDEYCRRLHESNETYYALMDRNLIRYGGGFSQMEFCDLFTKDKKLLHLKRYSGSSVLSHLFAQGTNCARTLLSDPEFRKKVNAKLPPDFQIDAEKPPISREYEIVFGIISKTADDLPDKLPFFSKITLMRAMQELHEVIGFKMSLAGIKVVA